MNDRPTTLPDDSPPVPEPAWWQARLTRLILTVFALLLTGACIALFRFIRGTDQPRPRLDMLGDVRLMLGLLLFVLLCFVPVRWQYRGIFQDDPAAALRASLAWYLIAALIMVPTVLLLLHAPAVVGIAPTGALFAGLGFAGQRRRQLLLRHRAEHPGARPRPGIVREARVWAWLLCGAMGVASPVLWLPGSPPVFGTHVDAEKAGLDLPDGAVDVCFYRNYAWIAYEFTTDEQRFRDWITSAAFAAGNCIGEQVVVAEIEAPFEIMRYASSAPRVEQLADEWATVAEGLQGTLGVDDDRVRAAFDRKTGRAYLFVRTRTGR